ncbi:hypothetical protein QLQ15_01815 [Lysobacter sp. LF1]|uniref:AraC family transcriptional regulator n=1 Tax=Lysobacter stagni TaxID=3045172 RepID=A0ABT6XBX7_9GAMM|nr:hypothetical protein [Lysobacter sp. LF1]MDI9237643.1 hypothetical protein [Lysobacter sp. LF1]
MKKVFLCAALPFVLAFASATAWAQDNGYREQMKGLDEQVQEVKSDALSIAAELSQLEEKLLYPSETQFAIFIQLAKGDTLRLDSVAVRVDGKPAAQYIYSFKELEALQKGGVQRLHTGNIASGEHQLEVSVTGKLANGSDYTHTETAAFTKEIKPKLLGLTVSSSSTSVQDW